MSIETLPALRPTRAPWNKGRIVGQKRPLLPKHVWSIRVRLEMADNKRDLALFNMTIDCKLRGCDLVCLKVNDVYAAGRVKERAQIRPFVVGVDKGVLRGRGGDGKDRPCRRGEIHCGTALDHQMICQAVKDGGGDSVAGHVMRPGYRRRRRNGEGMRN